MRVSEAFSSVVDRFGFGGDDADSVYNDADDDPDRYGDGDASWGTTGRTSRVALVRPTPVEFAAVTPQSFDDAQGIADRFRKGLPVIIDLQDCDAELCARLIDFVSGLTYALDGSLRFVAPSTLLLAPGSAEVSGEAAGGGGARGFYNQR
jgi:cell division inhibitor SepF